MTIDRDPTAVFKVSTAIRAKEARGRDEGITDMDIQRLAIKRSIIYIEPSKVISWDHRRLGGAY